MLRSPPEGKNEFLKKLTELCRISYSEDWRTRGKGAVEIWLIVFVLGGGWSKRVGEILVSGLSFPRQDQCVTKQHACLYRTITV